VAYTDNWHASALIRAGLVGTVIACAGVPVAAVAADWHLNSSITEEFTYDDNFRLSANDEQSLWGFNTRPRVGIETHTPRTDLLFDGILNYGYFPDDTDQNSFDQAGNVSLQHRTERSVFSFGGGVSHATTRTTEDEDTGRDLSDTERLGFTGSAAWSYAVTERFGAGIQTGANYVTYDTNVLDDYRSYTAGPFVTFQLTEKDTVRLNATYTNFKTLSGLDNESDLYVGNAVWTHTFHPQWVVSLRAGGNYVETEEEVQSGSTTVTNSDSKAGFDAGATITYTEERATITGSFTHSVVPSGNGRLERRNQLALSANYAATPKIDFGLKTSFIQQDPADGDSEDRNFVSAEPGISWHFLPDWKARVAYRFRTQTLDEGDRAYSNGGLASVTWSLPSWGANQGK